MPWICFQKICSVQEYVGNICLQLFKTAALFLRSCSYLLLILRKGIAPKALFGGIEALPSFNEEHH